MNHFVVLDYLEYIKLNRNNLWGCHIEEKTFCSLTAALNCKFSFKFP